MMLFVYIFIYFFRIIVGKSIYKDFVNSDLIQKSLIDPLRKGQTILPAIECFNMIDEHLLSIHDVEHAGKVLLDFVKTPKKFTFCRYPLLLCCLVCEFSNKCKERFPVYESFFIQIYNSFSTSGQLFVDKIRKDSILEYHLNQKDLRNRTCLQIMSQNRLYHMLEDSDVSAIIGKYWSGSSIQFGLFEFSCFNHLMKRGNYDEIFSLKNFSLELNAQNNFFFNYYSYRDVASIRYYFNKAWNTIIVICYMILIYKAIQDRSLKETKDKTFPFLQSMCEYGVYILLLNKINSFLYFLFVDKWWVEIDHNLLELMLFLSTIFHFRDLQTWFINESKEDDIEIANSCSISMILLIIWYKFLTSLTASKIFGGFIRTMILLVRKMFFIVLFFYAFIMMCTGIFNLFFNEFNEFDSYSNAWFYLFQAALQEFTFSDDFSLSIKYSICVFMIICTCILINLIIAYSTNIYKSVDENVDSEYRAKLVEIYEYFKWDSEYGIFKFFFAPFSIFQIPFSLLLLLSKNKEYWNQKFTIILYSLIGFCFFLVFTVTNLLMLGIAYIKGVCVKIIQGSYFKAITLLVFGPFYYIIYYFFDIYNFWVYIYKKPYLQDKDKEDLKQSIQNIKTLFSSLVIEISERIRLEKKRKEIYLSDLVGGWLKNMSMNNSMIFEENRVHKRMFLMNKYSQDSKDHKIIESKKEMRQSHMQVLKEANKNSIFHSFKQILSFLNKFSNSDGKIDVDLAKNIFPRKHYYDNEYFEFLHHFHFTNFGSLLRNNNKEDLEERKEMNKLRGVLTDLEKITKKFYSMKFLLRNLDFSEFELLEFSINNINTSFAVLEKNLLDAQNKEELKKIMIQAGPTETSKDGNLFNKLQDVAVGDNF